MKPKKQQGLALLGDEERKRIARLGVEALNKSGKRHHFTPDQLKKGGQRAAATNVKKPGYMRKIGEKGGRQRALNAGLTLRKPLKSQELVELENRVFADD